MDHAELDRLIEQRLDALLPKKLAAHLAELRRIIPPAQ